MKRGKLRTVLLLPDKPILIGCRKKLTSVSESIFRDDMQNVNFSFFFQNFVEKKVKILTVEKSMYS